METIPSFAPLAARLAAQAAALRPADEARDDLAKLAALVMCALLEMLICVCVALDARAATSVRPVAAPVSAPRADCHAASGKTRGFRPSLVRAVRAVAPNQAACQSGVAEATPTGPRLVWSHDPGPLPWGAPASLGRDKQETRLFLWRSRTPILLRYCN